MSDDRPVVIEVRVHPRTRSFAEARGRACCLELGRYLRAGVPAEELAELVADVEHALSLGTHRAMGGGEA